MPIATASDGAADRVSFTVIMDYTHVDLSISREATGVNFIRAAQGSRYEAGLETGWLGFL
jgi:hypothetical protein